MTRVKVCGTTNPEDALAAAEAGADAIGLIFAESPRRVSTEEAQRVARALPDGVLKVGVFVDEEPGEVLRIAETVGLDYVQLHGDERAEAVTELRAGGVRVIKALRVRDSGSLSGFDGHGADLYLLDAWSARARGGTGEQFDWDIAKSLRGRANIVVSGGLGPENVGEAVRFLEPAWVDAVSSLEKAPGRKDHEKVRRFVRAAKGL
jgi:phosphoribosylanthranilate isomerase